MHIHHSNIIKRILVVMLLVSSLSVTAFATPEQDLLQALEDLNFPGLQQALQTGADPDTRFPDGELQGATALMIAASSIGRIDMVRALLDQGANVNLTMQHPDYEGVTALMLAAGEGHAKIIRLLIDRGADLGMTIAEEGSEGTTATMVAIGMALYDKIGLEILELLLQQTPPDQQPVMSYAEGLAMAAEAENSEVIHLLFSYGAELEPALKGLKYDKDARVFLLREHENYTVELKEQQTKQFQERFQTFETPNQFYVQGYRYEQTESALAIAMYQALLERFPDSDLAIKAIDRLDRLSRGKFSHLQTQLILTVAGAGVSFFDITTGDIWFYDLEKPETPKRARLIELGQPLLEME